MINLTPDEVEALRRARPSEPAGAPVVQSSPIATQQSVAPAGEFWPANFQNQPLPDPPDLQPILDRLDELEEAVETLEEEVQNLEDWVDGLATTTIEVCDSENETASFTFIIEAP